MLGLFLSLFLGMAVAFPIEEGYCRVTTDESIVMAYTQNKYTAFRFRWLVDADGNVTTNLAGVSAGKNYKFNSAENVLIENFELKFSGTYPLKGIYYEFERNLDANNNVSKIIVSFMGVNRAIWEGTNLLCEVTIEGKTQYFPHDDNTIKYFRELYRPTAEE
jgi:hypothetical protein